VNKKVLSLDSEYPILLFDKQATICHTVPWSLRNQSSWQAGHTCIEGAIEVRLMQCRRSVLKYGGQGQ